MRKILVKFCDERKKEFCMKTIIWKDGEEKKVSKEAIYPEGRQNLMQMLENSNELAKIYPQVEICPVKGENNVLWFEYIDGVEYEKLILEEALKDDRKGFFDSLNLFCKIIESVPDNHTEFHVTDDFIKIFGDGMHFIGLPALKKSNYDLIPGNIIIRNGMPVLIDYEWTMDFPIPVALLEYHALRELYIHCKELESIYPLDEIIKQLGIPCERKYLEDAYWKFLEYVSGNSSKTSFSTTKHACLQKMYDFEQYKNNYEVTYLELLKSMDTNKKMEKAWKEASQANALLNKSIEKLKMELEQEKENHRIHAKQIEDAVQEQARQSEVWRIAYESVTNSRTWRWANKFKRLIGRK